MPKEKQEKPKKFTKPNLPTKVCRQCGREMLWRKRWGKTWEQVKFCSERCRRNKNSA
jgi:hypothetical protein